MEAVTLRIGEVAERAGVHVETLRYYERRGLLPSPERDPSGWRRYPTPVVGLVRAIKEAQRLGFTLAEIERFRRASARGDARDALRRSLEQRLEQADRDADALAAARDQLRFLLAEDSLPIAAAVLAGARSLPAQAAAAADGPLHVTNGDSTVHSLVRAGLDGDVIAWRDILHEGPVPGSLDSDALAAVRARFLTEQ